MYDRRKVYIEAWRNDSTITHGVRLFITMSTFMVDARWSKIWVANEVVKKTRPLVFSVKESVPLDSPERSLALHRRFNWLSKARWSARERLPFYALLLFTGRSRSGNNVKILVAIFSFWVTATYLRFCAFEILVSSTEYQTPTSWKFAKSVNARQNVRRYWRFTIYRIYRRSIIRPRFFRRIKLNQTSGI